MSIQTAEEAEGVVSDAIANDDEVIDVDFTEINEGWTQPIQTTDTGWIIILGSVVFGLYFRGPFATHDEAVAYASTFHHRENCQFAQIAKAEVN
jgi:hypothetical protein